MDEARPGGELERKPCCGKSPAKFLLGTASLHDVERAIADGTCLDLGLACVSGGFGDEQARPGAESIVECTQQIWQNLVRDVFEEETGQGAVPSPIRSPVPKIDHLELRLVGSSRQPLPCNGQHLLDRVEQPESFDSVDDAVTPVSRSSTELDTIPVQGSGGEPCLNAGEIIEPLGVALRTAVVVSGAGVDVVVPGHPRAVVGDLVRPDHVLDLDIAQIRLNLSADEMSRYRP